MQGNFFLKIKSSEGQLGEWGRDYPASFGPITLRALVGLILCIYPEASEECGRFCGGLLWAGPGSSAHPVCPHSVDGSRGHTSQLGAGVSHVPRHQRSKVPDGLPQSGWGRPWQVPKYTANQGVIVSHVRKMSKVTQQE